MARRTTPPSHDAKAHALKVARRLGRHYGRPRLGNRHDPLEELVLISLSRQTHEQNTTRSWAALRQAYPTWEALLAAPEAEVVAVIQEGGFARQKAAWIQEQLRRIGERFGELSLDALRSWPDDEAERFLCTLPGVQVKTARCVLMYALDRQVLPVDTHVRRLAERLGWVPEGLSAKAIHAALDALIPPRWRYRVHVGGVLHGRLICKAPRPMCQRCLVSDVCAHARAMAAEGWTDA